MRLCNIEFHPMDTFELLSLIEDNSPNKPNERNIVKLKRIDRFKNDEENEYFLLPSFNAMPLRKTRIGRTMTDFILIKKSMDFDKVAYVSLSSSQIRRLCSCM